MVEPDRVFHATSVFVCRQAHDHRWGWPKNPCNRTKRHVLGGMSDDHNWDLPRRRCAVATTHRLDDGRVVRRMARPHPCPRTGPCPGTGPCPSTGPCPGTGPCFGTGPRPGTCRRVGTGFCPGTRLCFAVAQSISFGSGAIHRGVTERCVSNSHRRLATGLRLAVATDAIAFGRFPHAAFGGQSPASKRSVESPTDAFGEVRPRRCSFVGVGRTTGGHRSSHAKTRDCTDTHRSTHPRGGGSGAIDCRKADAV